ncbi:zf-HC2 domain-containing protein [Actinoallomurus purpureus]|uniref:anti-sigma factor family protein n=1 Tax=Actinoallomurus purpureus TaxID=478114 RepID=UPI002094023D|nr:zf-HC2 domain-containing protein [Actinoallomurus purpureus]MCO6009523.1 zf-HC2 domain-containing protein [Actinoallomurus purpureus]
MSGGHLGERLTALIDGELGHHEREKAHRHLAACGECRAEAEALRGLKKRLRSLSDTMPSEGLLRRLEAMGEPGDPLPPPVPRLPGQARPPVVARPGDVRPSHTRPSRPSDNRPRRAAATGRRLPRGRYLLAGAATLAVLGVGSAAFAAGADPGSLPRVTPSVEQFAVEHALTSGDVPLTDPRPEGTAGDHP